jgi:hypothetical protein
MKICTEQDYLRAHATPINKTPDDLEFDRYQNKTDARTDADRNAIVLRKTLIFLDKTKSE